MHVDANTAVQVIRTHAVKSPGFPRNRALVLTTKSFRKWLEDTELLPEYSSNLCKLMELLPGPIAIALMTDFLGAGASSLLYARKKRKDPKELVAEYMIWTGDSYVGFVKFVNAVCGSPARIEKTEKTLEYFFKIGRKFVKEGKGEILLLELKDEAEKEVV